MPAGLDLLSVRKGRGRVHLTPARTADGIVHTLCGKQLAEASVTDDRPDCQACLRRETDPAILSSTFFNQDEGSRLLELSLVAAQRRREGRPDLRLVPAPRPPAAAAPPPPPPQPPPPERRGELRLAGLREFADSVYVSPGGVIVRLEGDRIVEVSSEARARLTRTPSGMRLHLADMLIEQRDGTLDARLDRPRPQ